MLSEIGFDLFPVPAVIANLFARGTDGQQFLSDCFAEFNTIIEQANPIERKVTNFLKFSDYKEDTESQPSSPSNKLKSIAQKFVDLSSWNRIEKIQHFSI